MVRGYPAVGGADSRHSPVIPSQQPIFKRQRGHWNVPWRHSITAPQRQHGSVAGWLAGVGANVTGRAYVRRRMENGRPNEGARLLRADRGPVQPRPGRGQRLRLTG